VAAVAVVVVRDATAAAAAAAMNACPRETAHHLHHRCRRPRTAAAAAPGSQRPRRSGPRPSPPAWTARAGRPRRRPARVRRAWRWRWQSCPSSSGRRRDERRGARGATRPSRATAGRGRDIDTCRPAFRRLLTAHTLYSGRGHDRALDSRVPPPPLSSPRRAAAAEAAVSGRRRQRLRAQHGGACRAWVRAGSTGRRGWGVQMVDAGGRC
jgi:hypothetical protein